MFNVQRAVSPKFGFMCSACCLIVLCICVKFSKNISNGIKVIEQT